MNVFTKCIKRLMGWCPNAKVIETGSQISNANFEAYSRSGDEKARSPRFSSQFSRLDVRILLPTVFLTLYHINLLFQKGVNAESFLLGILLTLPIYVLGWKKQMRQYDALEKKPVVFSYFKKTFFYVFLFLILGFILFMVFLPYILSRAAHLLSAQILYSLTAGSLVPMLWGFYFQLVYWERKNQRKIYVKNENGFEKIYTVGEKEGKL